MTIWKPLSVCVLMLSSFICFAKASSISPNIRIEVVLKSGTQVKVREQFLKDNKIPYVIANKDGWEELAVNYHVRFLLGFLCMASAVAALYLNNSLLEEVIVRETLKELRMQALLEKGGETNHEVKKPEKELWFDWDDFKVNHKAFSHIAVFGPTGTGKTFLTDWLIDLFPHDDMRMILTPKSLPEQWRGVKVIGVPEKFADIHLELEKMEARRVDRLAKVQRGDKIGYELVVLDEVRSIISNTPEESEKKRGEAKVVLRKSGREILINTVTMAREAQQRLVIISQGRQVETIGLKGESDLRSCFTQIYLGKFAIDMLITYLASQELKAKIAMGEESFEQWSIILNEMKKAGKRAAYVVCEHGNFPAIVPDLSNWRRLNNAN